MPRLHALLIALAIVVMAALPAPEAHAAAFTVINTNDSGAGSLRAAILAANANGTGADIIDATGVTGSIPVTSGELLINSDLTINGPGANLLSVSGNLTSRIFNVGAGRTVSINGLTVTGGRVQSVGGDGILNAGNLTLNDVAIGGNSFLFDCTAC